jgi:hypothetical protein
MTTEREQESLERNEDLEGETIHNRVVSCVQKIYQEDNFLFERNRGKGVCERCLVFRLAHYLQLEFNEYFVDCDFNSSFEYTITENGRENERERSGKGVENEDGSITKRFVDIIIHKRDYTTENDFICFEIKKWNNYTRTTIEKDINNLRQLTNQFNYKYGYHIILGKTFEETKWSILKNGRYLIENELI